MRLTSKLMAFAAALAMVAFIGCSDDTNATPDKGPIADKGPGNEGGSPDLPKGNEGGGPDLPTGSCPADIQSKKWGGKSMTEIVSAQSACLVDANPPACILAAVKTATNGEVPDACIGCYGTSALCTATNCLADCVTAAPPTPVKCGACRCGTNTAKINCVQVFETCAGNGVKSTTTCQ